MIGWSGQRFSLRATPACRSAPAGQSSAGRRHDVGRSRRSHLCWCSRRLRCPPRCVGAYDAELGIAGPEDRAVTGELDGLDDVALAAKVERMPVYPRVTAEHKLRSAWAWRRRGEVVAMAMTGDGVNDAPAVMRRPPRPLREPVLTRASIGLILTPDALVAGVSRSASPWPTGKTPAQLAHARTVAFCVMAYGQLFLAFAARSHGATVPELGLFTNLHLLGAILVSGLLQLGAVAIPVSHRVFGTTDHPAMEWLLVFGLALLPVAIVERAKLGRAFVRGVSRG